MVDADGSSWHKSNRGVSMYIAIYMTLFFSVILMAKFLHDRPTLSGYFPEAAMIILVGIFAGCLFNLVVGNPSGFVDAQGDESMAESMLSFSPTVFFVVLLPPIIFSSGYFLRRDLFFRHIIPICLLACVGTVVACVVFACFCHATRFLYPSFTPSFLELLTFGALISASDPVSTLAVFQAKQVDPHLFYLVFGESVINDAVGLVLFQAMAHLVEKNLEGESLSLGAEVVQFVVDFLLGFVCSMFLGCVTGLATAWLFKAVDMRHTPILELCMQVRRNRFDGFIVVFFSGMVACCVLGSLTNVKLLRSLRKQIAHLSGIVTVLFAGITAKRYIEPNLSSTTAQNATTIFRLTAHVNETIIFLELGLSVFGLWGVRLHWGFVLASLLGCLISRAMNVYPMTFIYNKSCGRSSRRLPENDSDWSTIGYNREKQVALDVSEGEMPSPVVDDRPIPIKTAHMLFFSGLRGAVSYALVRTFPSTGHELDFTITCMVIVLLTTFVLGGATETVLNFLDIPMGVDEQVYLKSLERRYFLKGPMRRFEAYTLRRWVIRDFEKKTEEEAYMQDDDEMFLFGERIEVTEVDHMETIAKQHKINSIYDFGNHF